MLHIRPRANLFSFDFVTGYGLALTLTIRDCPPTSDDWHRLRNAFIRRLKRAGMIRLHWVTEWQKRGVPHLHCAVWFEDLDPNKEGELVRVWGAALKGWAELAAPYGASPKSQKIAEIDNSVGWFQYLSKHASRGVKHYQRSSAGIPAEWKQKTGRMWGHWGNGRLVKRSK